MTAAAVAAATVAASSSSNNSGKTTDPPPRSPTDLCCVVPHQLIRDYLLVPPRRAAPRTLFSTPNSQDSVLAHRRRFVSFTLTSVTR